MTETSTRSVERALSLLGYVCRNDGVTLTDAATACELAPSSALRLLRTLEKSGFIVRQSTGSLYEAGPEMLQLGASVLSNDSLRTISAPRMAEMAQTTGESVYLVIPGSDDRAVYIAMAEGTHSIRHASWVGNSIPLSGSAAGLALTGQTPPSGFALVPDVVEQDVTAIAAPILAGTHIVAALSIVAPSYRTGSERQLALGERVAREAAALSSALGHRPRPANRRRSVGRATALRKEAHAHQ